MGILIGAFSTTAKLTGRWTAVCTNPGSPAYDPTASSPGSASPTSITITGSFQQGGPEGFQVDGESGLATTYNAILISTTEEIARGLAAASLSSFVFTPNVTVILLDGVDYQVSKIRIRTAGAVETAKEFLLNR